MTEIKSYFRKPGSRKKRHVVYTTLFGFSEPFSDHQYDDDTVDYICFTDDRTLRSSHWQFVHVENKLLDPPRLAKTFKHLPHVYLGEYERCLYIDNTVELKIRPSALFNRFSDTLVLLRHPLRDCVYDEADAVISAHYDDPVRVNEQMNFYKSLAYPAHNGLSFCAFLLRNHNEPAMRNVNVEWHRQVLRYSKRDQLSWNVCAWFHRFYFRTLNDDVMDNEFFAWPVVSGGIRLPRDFEDGQYLSLNVDVRAAEVDPRQHFLVHGMAEGRRYK
jgi:Protein of unknown function (DUF616)